MSGSPRELHTPTIDEIREKARTVYKDDVLGRKGDWGALLDATDHATKEVMPDLASAIKAIDEMVAEGSGICVPGVDNKETTLYSLFEIAEDKQKALEANEVFKPMTLLDLLREIVGTHVYHQLRNDSEIEELRNERGELY